MGGERRGGEGWIENDGGRDENTSMCAATEVDGEEERMRAQRLVETVEGNESL
jgi:hypothetical protein